MANVSLGTITNFNNNYVVFRVWLTALEIFLPTYKSLLQEVVNICPGLLAAYFTFVEISIAVERLMATFYVKTYENSHSSAMYLNIGIPVQSFKFIVRVIS